jgi:hypothetical protein
MTQPHHTTTYVAAKYCSTLGPTKPIHQTRKLEKFKANPTTSNLPLTLLGHPKKKIQTPNTVPNHTF